jgi:hypothetical protein
MMDCQHARLLLEFARPGTPELEPSEAMALGVHLDDCADCARAADRERRVDDVVGRALRDVPVPPGLRERLLNRLNAERDAWYRKWLVRGVGLAASIILAVWLGQALWFSRLPGVDWVILANDLEPRHARQVEDWFRLRQVSMVTPAGFNFDLLNAYGVSELQGRRVPHLVFLAPAQGAERPAALAHVYVLSARQFDLEKTKQTVNEVYFQHTVLVEKPPEHPEFLFLIISTSKSLDAFKAPRAVH